MPQNEQGASTLKKLTAAILALAMVLTTASAAMVEFTGRTPIHLITDDTTRSHTVTPPVTKHGDYWSVSIDESTSNLSPTHRVLVRVHRGANSIALHGYTPVIPMHSIHTALLGQLIM